MMVKRPLVVSSVFAALLVAAASIYAQATQARQAPAAPSRTPDTNLVEWPYVAVGGQTLLDQ